MTTQSQVMKQEKERVARLDRNRELRKRLTYRVVGKSDLDKVYGLLYASHHQEDPITNFLGLEKGLNSIKDADREVGTIIVKNLSVLAEDQNGKVVGVVINNSCHKSDVNQDMLDKEMEEVEDPKYRPVIAIRQQLQQQALHVYEEVGTDIMFSIRCVGVDPTERGQGIVTDLIRRSVLLGGSLGYCGIKAQATSQGALKAYQTVGLLPISSIKYSDFTYDGEKTLSGVSDWKGDTEITFLRKKFFQSALKHIL